MLDKTTGLLCNSGTASFLGYAIQQYWMDLAIWELFLQGNTICSLIELGTGYCGMSTYLFLQCIQRNLQFLTFDIKPKANLDRPLSKFLGLGEHFIETDIFANSDLVKSSIERMPKPLLLFCDNGNKPREFSIFVPLLSSGDYVVVHDWGSEIRASDVEGFSIEPVMKEECENWKSITRFWRISD